MAEHAELAAVRAEHKELLRGLEDIRRLVEAGHGEMGVSPWAARLRGELHRLSSRLDHHFKREEGGFYRIIAEERPTRSRQIERLRREHETFMEDLAAIMDRCLRPPEDTLLEDVRDGLLAWLTDLHRHERLETELLVEAVVRDVGAPD